MKIIQKEVNIETGEETTTEREETTAEVQARVARNAEVAVEQAEAAVKATAKSALLERLGITAEEAALLLS